MNGLLTKLSPLNIRSALNLLPLGIIVVTSDATVLMANESAVSILESENILAIEDGQVVVRSAPHQKALRSALAEVQRDTGTAAVGFSVGRTGKKPLSITILTTDTRDITSRSSQILILISDPEVAPAADLSLLSALFDLTPTEAAIANLFMAGYDTTRVSRELKIAKSTLRNHLKHMFAKTNTRNQGELLHLLLTSPAHLRLPHTVRFSSGQY
jgi:DNA-binding CsgD family transcriptional regulator